MFHPFPTTEHKSKCYFVIAFQSQRKVLKMAKLRYKWVG